MELFTWYNKYSVGNEEIDGHHKALFGILNRLYENCMVNKNANCLEPIVEELVAYTKYHFSAEEKLMKELGYQDLDNHRAQHNAFTERAMQLEMQSNKDDFETTKELIVFLGNWLLKHVMEEDKKIRGCPG